MADTQEFVAIETGFHDGARIHKGQKFTAPVGFKAKWAVPPEEIDARGGTIHEDPIRALLDRSAKEVAAAIGSSGLSTADEFRRAIDAEMAGEKRKSVLSKLQDAYTNAKAAEPDALLS